MKKSIIIDFDHTIGFFDQIIFLINIIETTYEKTLSLLEIYNILNYYPYIFRYLLELNFKNSSIVSPS